MLAIILLIIFIYSGIYITRQLLPNTKILDRVWIGICLGFTMLMILPAGLAFVFGFTKLAHFVAILIDFILVFIAYKAGANTNKPAFDEDDKKTLIYALSFVLPFTLLMGYLQYTHTLMPKDNALWVGQSTYGDLSLHLSIITGAVDSSFPMDYRIFPGVRLGYPFLIDTLSSTFYMFGLSLQASIIVPGTIISACIFFGFFLLAKRIAKDNRAAALAFILLFLNGGLGILYDLDFAGGEFFDRINQILTGYYQTPVNRPEPHNLVWANIIADMLLPQRTFMAGVFIFLPCIYLILNSLLNNRLYKKGELIALIIFASSLPMINTHAFLALGIFSIVQMIFQTYLAKQADKKTKFIQFAIFGLCTIALTLPQLYTWTFAQSLSSKGFIRFHFNWINNNNGTLRDLYPIFYLKNMGIVLVPMLMSLFTKDRKLRSIIVSALAIFLITEIIVFQPNLYDNNKLIYMSFLIMLIPTSKLIIKIYDALKAVPGRALIATLFIFICTISGGLSLARECVSSYEAYSEDSVSLSEFIIKNTDRDSVFATANNHLNPISSLAGRKIVCGPDLWLYYHGINTSERKKELENFYTSPDKDNGLLDKYNVEYILLGPSEIYSYKGIDIDKMEKNFSIAYQNDSYTLYKVE